MKTPRPWTLCHRHACRQPFHLHKGGACLDGKGDFVRHPPDSVTRASFSLSERELKALDIITRGLINGRELKQIARGLHDELGGLIRKITKARETIEHKKQQRSSAPTRASADSQVVGRSPGAEEAS